MYEMTMVFDHMLIGMISAFHHPVGIADMANVVLAGGMTPLADRDSRAALKTCAAFVAARLGSWYVWLSMWISFTDTVVCWVGAVSTASAEAVDERRRYRGAYIACILRAEVWLRI